MFTISPKEFAKYLKRDGECVHCGLDDDSLIPQHRANRGAGGSKKRDVPSNIIVLCSAYNGLIESDAEAARFAKEFGYKLESWEDPKRVPFYSRGKWWILDDSYNRFVFEEGNE